MFTRSLASPITSSGTTWARIASLSVVGMAPSSSGLRRREPSAAWRVRRGRAVNRIASACYGRRRGESSDGPALTGIAAVVILLPSIDVGMSAHAGAGADPLREEEDAV